MRLPFQYAFATTSLVLVVVLVPLAKGGMVPAWWSVWLGLPLAAALAGLLREARPGGAPWVWLLPWAAVSAWIVVQLVLGTALGTRSPEIVDAVPIAPVGAANVAELAGWWARFTGYWAIVMLSAGLGRGGLRAVLGAVLAMVVFETLYGLIAFGGGQETILGIWPKVAYLQDVTGSFVNKNHFAGFLACALPLALGALTLRHARGGLFRHAALRYGSAGVVALIAGAALLASHSRLGAVAALIGLMVWLALAARLEPRRDAQLPRWLPWAIGAIALAGGLWFGLGPLVSRFMAISQDSRYEAWVAMLDLPWRSWLLGIGPSAFEDVYRLVQPASNPAQWRYAHNDYLQFVLEMGVIGTLLVAAAFAYWARRCWRGLRHPLHAAALGGIAAIAVHSAGDFNLHIPGVAVVFWVGVGILFNPGLAARGAGNSREWGGSEC